MKAEELRIGDLVYYETPKGEFEIHKVKPQTLVNMEKSEYLCEHIQPIPLTPEMLIDDFGFTDGEFYAELLLHDEANTQIQCDCMNLRIRNSWREMVNIFCGSVHELQHALRLCKIDIEIGL